jgi:hypothetical protein
VHRYGAYDFTLDTSLLSPEENAEKLIALIDSDCQPEAFARIRRAEAPRI